MFVCIALGMQPLWPHTRIIHWVPAHIQCAPHVRTQTVQHVNSTGRILLVSAFIYACTSKQPHHSSHLNSPAKPSKLNMQPGKLYTTKHSFTEQWHGWVVYRYRPTCMFVITGEQYSSRKWLTRFWACAAVSLTTPLTLHNMRVP